MEKVQQQCPMQIVQEFFKVFLPSTSSARLGLPRAFTRFFNGTTPSQATLVDSAGNSWDIKLENIKDALVLTDGWEEFVSGKGLEEADFLVFEYDGNSTFHVKIFCKSGIRKDPKNPGKKHVPVVILDDDSDPGGSDQSRGKMLRSVKREGSPSTNPKTTKKSNSEVQTFAGPSQTRGKTQRPSEAHGNDYDEIIEMNSTGLAKGSVLMKNPHFAIPFSSDWKLTRSNLEIPRVVLRRLNVRLAPMINMRDENDDEWPVKVLYSAATGRTYLSRGWPSYRNAKKIKRGQLCVFKFVIGRDNVAEQVLVRVRPPSKCPKLLIPLPPTS